MNDDGYVNLTSTSGYTGNGRGKIFAFVNGGGGDWWDMVAISEDGEGLTGHCCSHPSFGPGDMGCLAVDWSNKRKKYAAKYPDGYTLEWIDDITKRPDVLAAIKTGNERGDAEEAAVKLAECDCCNAMVPADEISRCIAAGGIETFACEKCTPPEAR